MKSLLDTKTLSILPPAVFATVMFAWYAATKNNPPPSPLKVEIFRNSKPHAETELAPADTQNLEVKQASSNRKLSF